MKSTDPLTASEVAELFFDRSGGWLKWREDQGLLHTEAGAPIGRRVGNKRGRRGGDRAYLLSDVSALAASLHRYGILDAQNERVILARVEAYAEALEALVEFERVRSTGRIGTCRSTSL